MDDRLARGVGEVAAHEIGHRIGFEGRILPTIPNGDTDLMIDGRGNPSGRNELYFKPTKDERRILEKIKAIGDNTPNK